MALPNCVNHHRYRVIRDTDKASIFFYTVIDLIALGAHDGRTRGPDKGKAASFQGC
jgi:hypothetical protein